MDLPRWERDNVLHVFYQPVNGQGYTAPANNAAPVGVLEWDAAAYFAHRPRLHLAGQYPTHVVLAWNSQPGWTYRLQTSTNLTTWHDLTTRRGRLGRCNSSIPTAGMRRRASGGSNAGKGRFPRNDAALSAAPESLNRA